MNTQQMRKYISKLYGDSWKARVAKMSDAQVQAIYFRINSSKKGSSL